MPMPQRPNTDDPEAVEAWYWALSEWFETDQGLDEYFANPNLTVTTHTPAWIIEMLNEEISTLNQDDARRHQPVNPNKTDTD